MVALQSAAGYILKAERRHPTDRLPRPLEPVGWVVGEVGQWGGRWVGGVAGHETGIPDQEAAQAAQVARMLRARVLYCLYFMIPPI